MQRPLGILSILLFTLLIGCNSQDAKQSVGRENSHLRWLLRLYTQAVQQGHEPKSESDFKQYVSGIDAAARDRILAASDVNDLNELFTSERDGLPYVIFYGATPKGVAKGLVAFEQQGVDGGRYVGYSLGVVEDVDEQRFNELVPPTARTQK